MGILKAIFNTVSSSDSIGIIGGADGPTVIIVAGDIDWVALGCTALAIAAVIVVAVISIRKKKKLL